MRPSTSSLSSRGCTRRSSSSPLEEEDVYPFSEGSEDSGDLGFLCASGCKMVGNRYCLLGDSLFFCYVYPVKV